MIKNTINNLSNEYIFPQAFKESMLGVYNALTSCEIECIISTYNGKTHFDFDKLTNYLQELNEKHQIDIRTLRLFSLICLIPKLKEEYAKYNIEESIQKDTILDIYCKYNECKNIFGIDGVDSWGWYKGIFTLNVLALGRLQFEFIDFHLDSYTKNGFFLKKGDTVLTVHIPNTGTPLNHDECLKSYKRAKEFYANYFKGEKVPIICWSWIMNPKHYELLNENSNILKFMNDYDIIDKAEYDDFNLLSSRVFGKESIESVDKIPENSSLQRIYKQHLLNGGKLGWGLGVLKI